MAQPDLVSLIAVRRWLKITQATDDYLLSRLITQVSRAVYNDIARSIILPEAVTQYYNGMGRPFLLLRDWPVTNVTQVVVDGVLVPPAPPMTAGQALQPGWTLEEPDDQPPGAMQKLVLRGYVFSKGLSNVLVSYTAGYQITNEAQIVPLVAPPGQYEVIFGTSYGTWGNDLGVTYAASGVPLTAVTGTPTTAGQYTVNENGTYNFNMADAGAAILLSYGYIPADLEHCTLEWVAHRYKARDRIGEKSKSIGGQETVSYDTSSKPDFVEEGLQPFRRIIAN